MDAQTLATQMLDAVKGYVGRASAALEKRIGEVEMLVLSLPTPKDGKEGPPGKDGKDADRDLIIGALGPELFPLVCRAVEDRLKTLPASVKVGEGKPLTDGESGDVYLDIKSGDLYRWN